MLFIPCGHRTDAIKSSHWLPPFSVCVCLCGVWRIVRGSQAVHVNGTLCQLSRLLIHQALLYQTIHPHTYAHTHTSNTQHTFATQRRHTQMHHTKRGSRVRLNPGALEDGVCLYQTYTRDGAGWWGLLSLVWVQTARRQRLSQCFLKGQDRLALAFLSCICWCQNVASVL